MTVRMSVLELSRGSIWKPYPSEPPYLVADPGGQPFPAGAQCYVVFSDTAGSEIGRIDAAAVTEQTISFLAAADDVDGIPAGANFEIFLDGPDGVDKIRYGKVIRREAEYFDAPAQQRPVVALNHTDTFPTMGLRSNWKAVAGRTRVYDNSAASLPNGVSANGGLFFAQSAIRWDTPLNTDTVKSRAVLLNQGAGRSSIIVCADQQFTTGLAVDFDSGTNRLHLGIVTSPTEVEYRTPLLSHAVVDLADYTLTYNELTKVLAVYAGTDLTPLKTWHDDLDEVPHGPGYRYTGFSFDTGLFFTPGIEVAGWQAKDD